MVRCPNRILTLLLVGGFSIFAFLWSEGGWTPRVAAQQEPSNPDAPAMWRTPRHDGTNSLYLFLRLRGQRVTYEHVAKTLPAGESGHSFLALREAARQLGMRTAVWQCGPVDLVPSRLPVIALVDNVPGKGGTFVVLYFFDGASFHVIDGASGLIKEIPLDDFRRRWAGSVLAPQTSRHPEMLSIGGGLLVVAGYGWWVRHARSRAGQP